MIHSHTCSTFSNTIYYIIKMIIVAYRKSVFRFQSLYSNYTVNTLIDRFTR